MYTKFDMTEMYLYNQENIEYICFVIIIRIINLIMSELDLKDIQGHIPFKMLNQEKSARSTLTANDLRLSENPIK